MLHPIKRTALFEAALHERYDRTGTRVVAFALAGTMAAGVSAAMAEQPTHRETPKPAAPTYQAQYYSPTLEQVIAPIRAQLIKNMKLKAMRASVPPRLDSAALLQSNGNPVAANQLLIAKGAPPMTLTEARMTAHRLHFAMPKRYERQVQQQVQHWEATTPVTKMQPVKHPETLTKNITGNISEQREADFRAGVIADARRYLGIRETVEDRGPVIDRFTNNHAIAWCAAMVSFIYNAEGMPLDGTAKPYADLPDYNIVRTRLNPTSPEIGSMQLFFRKQGYEFSAAQRLPEAADVLMFRTDSPEHPSNAGHTMLVERIMPDHRHARAIGGNMGDGVRETTIDLYDPKLVAIGSLFPEK